MLIIQNRKANWEAGRPVGKLLNQVKYKMMVSLNKAEMV